MRTEPVHSRDIGYNIRYIVSLQRAYKLSKPTKFAGGKWSPRAEELYRGLDATNRKIADEELALLSEDAPVDRWGNSIEVQEELECPDCGYKMVEKDGKYGLFYSCSQFPGCWGTLPHPDNPEPDFKEKPQPIHKEGMVLTDYVAYTVKRNFKKVKPGTPAEHLLWFGEDGPYKLRTKGSKHHLYLGDKCNFDYKVDWRGDSMINRKTLQAWDKKGKEIPKGERRGTWA
tara:strand:+ start:411 stop:1097 length:687 start_codon:yes stop_codon:yes gene_type:complete